MINGRTGREVGSGSVAGDPLGFRIETNLYSMAQRPGVAGAPITIHIRDPTGAEFTSVQNEAGVTTSLVNIPVNTSVYDTGPVWAADSPQYQAGTYEVWADSNANGMKDNYNQVGKTTTRSQPATGVQVGGTNGPSITVVGSTTPAPTGTAATTVTPTGTGTVTATAASTPAPTVTATGTAATTTGAATIATAAPATTQSPGFAATTLALATLATLGLFALRRR